MKLKVIALSTIVSYLLTMSACQKTSGYTDLSGQILRQFDIIMATTNQNHAVNSPYSTQTMSLQVLDSRAINYEVFIEKANKAGDYVTAVEIKLGDPTMIDGPLLVNLTGKFRQGWATGFVGGLRQTLVDTLLNNSIPKYVNVKTQREPLGLVRGQMNANIVISNNVFLSGTNLRPAVSTITTGLGLIRITTDNKLYSQIIISNDETGVDPVLSAQLISGNIGDNGTNIMTLVGAPTNFNKSQTFPLTVKQYEQLLSSNYYITVNSATYPNGKIGGQVK